MEQPSGFIDPARLNHVCKLYRSIYGLKQAPRVWFSRLSSYLVTIGFVGHVSLSLKGQDRSSSGSYLCRWHHHHRQWLTGCHSSYSRTRLRVLIKRPRPTALGVECHRTPSDLFLSQQKYIRDLLLQLKMDDVKPVSSPMATSCKLSKIVGKPLSDFFVYRSTVGALQYLSFTRPDIPFSMNKVAQSM